MFRDPISQVELFVIDVLCFAVKLDVDTALVDAIMSLPGVS